MSFLDQLKERKTHLKPTIINITHADGTQEQTSLSKIDDKMEEAQRVHLKSKTYGFVVDTKPDFVPACILPDFLYLGSQDAVMQKNVKKYQLTDILSVGIQTPAYDNSSSSIVRTHFVECLDLPETQLNPIVRQTNQILNSVHSRRGKVLVHCNAGVSRSSTICIVYLMFERKMCFDSAYALVKSKRECIRPNDGFLKQLKQMDQFKS